MTSGFDEYDFDLIAKNCSQEDPYILTTSKLFWTSLRVISKDHRNIHNFCSKMISDDEVIDEYGNPWNPNEHPLQDETISHVQYGVAIDIDSVAKIESQGSIKYVFLKFYFRTQF